MNIKTTLYVISLSAFATLQCADNEQLKAELAAKNAELQGLEKKLLELEAKLSSTLRKIWDLRDEIIRDRKKSSSTWWKAAIEQELRSEFIKEVESLITAFYSGKTSLTNDQFFKDFFQDRFLKFYIIKYNEERGLFDRTLIQWSNCVRERERLHKQLPCS